MNSGTRVGTSVDAFAAFTYCKRHFAFFLVTISGVSLADGVHTKRKNTILCQEHVSLHDASGRAGEVHHLSVEVLFKGLTQQCTVAVCRECTWENRNEAEY